MKTWRVLKTLWPTKTKCHQITKIGDEQDVSKMADILNEHFVIVGPNLSKQMPPGCPMQAKANLND